MKTTAELGITQEQHDLLYAPPRGIVAVPITSVGACENVRVVTGDGRVFDLGKPDSIWFKLRVFIYKLRRWREFHQEKVP